MKKHAVLKAAMLCAICATLAGTASAGETKIDAKDLPPAVSALTGAKTTAAEMTAATKLDDNGAITYRIEYDRAGHKFWNTYLPDGTQTAAEEEIQFADTSTEARAILQAKAGTNVIMHVMKTVKDGTIFYAATITKDGKTIETTVNKDGIDVSEKEVPGK